jgi:hypothetical protein
MGLITIGTVITLNPTFNIQSVAAQPVPMQQNTLSKQLTVPSINPTTGKKDRKCILQEFFALKEVLVVIEKI